MYPEKIDIWRRGQALTAARLNKTVNAVNYLLSLSAEQDADQPNGGATQINVAPPGGYVPPEASFANPPADDITALAQPFKFVGSDEVQIKTPPVYGLSQKVPDDLGDATPYYLQVKTDAFGEILSVTPSESFGSFYLWDGNNATGNFSIFCGALGKNKYGEDYSIDANPIAIPVIPVNAAPQDEEALSLIAGRKGNSVKIKALKSDGSVGLADDGDAINMSVKEVQEITQVSYNLPASAPTVSNGTITINGAQSGAAGVIAGISYNLTASSPTVSNGTITINGAQSGAAGVIAGINVELYEPSTESEATPPPQSKIEDGVITAYVPKAITHNDLKIAYDLTASSPGVSNGTITINGAQSGAAGVIAGINVELYDASDPSYATPPQAKIDKGIITIFVPKPQTCDCAGLLEKIEEAIEEAVNGVSVTATLAEPIMEVETGTISLSAQATINANGGSGSVSYSRIQQ